MLLSAETRRIHPRHQFPTFLPVSFGEAQGQWSSFCQTTQVICSLNTLFLVLIGLVFPSPLPWVSRLGWPLVWPRPSASGRGLILRKLGASF